jgi:endoribonuclease LACTB2
MSAKIRVAGCAVLYNEDRILLARRNPSARFFGDFFSFIGGELEAGESPLGATRREVKEELGISLDAHIPSDSLGVLTTPAFSPIRFETHFFAFPWSDESAPTPQNSELVETRWETAGDWLQLWEQRALKIPPPVLHFLRHAVKEPPSAKLWEQCRMAGEALEEGELHEIYFAPGLLMAPLRTPTLPPAEHTNCYILGKSTGLVVDPAPTDEEEQEKLDRLLKKLGFSPSAAVITHHHADHSAGAAAFAKRWGVPLLASPIDAGRVEGSQGHLVEGHVLETDYESWKIIDSPGHAQGHICLVGQSSHMAIVGDMISTVSTIVIDPPEGHMGTYLTSLRKLREAQYVALFPSHGPPAWLPEKTLSWFLKHREKREGKVRESLTTSPQELDQIIPAAYEDVDSVLWPLAARSALAHLIHLQEQGKSHQSKDGQWTLAATRA